LSPLRLLSTNLGPLRESPKQQCNYLAHTKPKADIAVLIAIEFEACTGTEVLQEILYRYWALKHLDVARQVYELFVQMYLFSRSLNGAPAPPPLSCRL